MNPAARVFTTTAAWSILAALGLIGLILMFGCSPERRRDPPANLAIGVGCIMEPSKCEKR